MIILWNPILEYPHGMHKCWAYFFAMILTAHINGRLSRNTLSTITRLFVCFTKIEAAGNRHQLPTCSCMLYLQGDLGPGSYACPEFSLQTFAYKEKKLPNITIWPFLFWRYPSTGIAPFSWIQGNR